MGFNTNWVLTVAISAISTAPLYAQPQPDPTKLKADAQNAVSIIKGDKAKNEMWEEHRRRVAD